MKKVLLCSFCPLIGPRQNLEKSCPDLVVFLCYGIGPFGGAWIFWCSRPCQEIGDSVLRCGELEVVS